MPAVSRLRRAQDGHGTHNIIVRVRNDVNIYHAFHTLCASVIKGRRRGGSSREGCKQAEDAHLSALFAERMERETLKVLGG